MMGRHYVQLELRDMEQWPEVRVPKAKEKMAAGAHS
jgi:hypothetical protein